MQNGREIVANRTPGVRPSIMWVMGVGFFVLLCIFLFKLFCQSTTEAAERSPGALYVATLEQLNCGATTRFQTFLMVAEVKSRFGLGIFGHRSENVFTLVGASSHLKLYWNDDTHLVVKCSRCQAKDMRIWKNNWEKVSIQYAFD
jgi:hypothetical protein